VPRSAQRLKARAIVAGLLLCSAARADGPLGPQGSRIKTSSYTFDLFQGPVLASTRVTAMAGAYTAIADGTEGIPFNAAAPAIRAPFSTTRDDFDITGSITFANLPIFGAASVIGTDFDNNGVIGIGNTNFVWLNGGFTIQHDQAGFGLLASAQQYNLEAPNESTSVVKRLAVRLFRADAVVSYGFLGERLFLGAGLRGVDFEVVDTTTSESLLFRSLGVGLQAGALWAPRELPLRVGGTIRSPILLSRGGDGSLQPLSNGDVIVPGTDIYLPDKINLPWELEFGVAFQLGPRPLNLAWIDEDTLSGPEVEGERHFVNGQLEPTWRGARRILQQRYRSLPRRKLLVSFSTLVTGPTADAVGFESMLARTVDRAGENATISTRLGGEAEVWPDRLMLRGGSYLEPTRFRDVARQELDPGVATCPNGSPAPPDRRCVVGTQPRPRLHGTFGFEVRLFEWDVFGLAAEHTSWRLSAAGDYARDYYGYSIAVGIWR
jgi:hypothetical protein